MAGKYEYLIMRKAVHIHELPNHFKNIDTDKDRVRDGICSV
jgi:hypothetical protein